MEVSKTKPIETREDVQLLVHSFYEKIRKDDLLGPIFNGIIPEENWESHLEKLTNFWGTALFGVVSYKGNPGLVHQKVDKEMNYSIEQIHFGQWLNLWYETINEFFEGDVANRAKDAARNMSTGLFNVMWHQKPKELPK